MARVKAEELRQLSPQELQERLEKLQRENFDLHQKKETGQLDRPHRFTHIRREISKIKLVMSEPKEKAGA